MEFDYESSSFHNNEFVISWLQSFPLRPRIYSPLDSYEFCYAHRHLFRTSNLSYRYFLEVKGENQRLPFRDIEYLDLTLEVKIYFLVVIY